MTDEQTPDPPRWPLPPPPGGPAPPPGTVLRPPSARMERRDIILIVAVLSLVFVAGVVLLGWLVWDFATCDCRFIE